MRTLFLSLTLAAATLVGTVLTPSSASAQWRRGWYGYPAYSSYYNSYPAYGSYYSYPSYSSYYYTYPSVDAGVTVTSPSVSYYTPMYYTTPGVSYYNSSRIMTTAGTATDGTVAAIGGRLRSKARRAAG
jgi:hypothetical protein